MQALKLVVDQRQVLHDACALHKAVERTVLLHDAHDQLLQRVDLGQISRMDGMALAFEHGERLLQALLRQVDHGHARAQLAQGNRGLPADARTAAGDQHMLTGHLNEIHESFLPIYLSFGSC